MIEPGKRSPTFVLTTGEALGERGHPETTASLDELATHVGAKLRETPGDNGRALTRASGIASPGLVATALDVLRALGRAVVTVDDRWFAAEVVVGG